MAVFGTLSNRSFVKLSVLECKVLSAPKYENCIPVHTNFYSNSIHLPSGAMVVGYILLVLMDIIRAEIRTQRVLGLHQIKGPAQNVNVMLLTTPLLYI